MKSKHTPKLLLLARSFYSHWQPLTLSLGSLRASAWDTHSCFGWDPLDLAESQPRSFGHPFSNDHCQPLQLPQHFCPAVSHQGWKEYPKYFLEQFQAIDIFFHLNALHFFFFNDTREYLNQTFGIILLLKCCRNCRAVSDQEFYSPGPG